MGSNEHPDLFDTVNTPPIELTAGARVLPGFATQAVGNLLLLEIEEIFRQSPTRQMVTPGGRKMSVGMSNCGHFGWVSDSSGYRYSPIDPISGLPWPAMPKHWLELAQEAAAVGGYDDFIPDACLINRYAVGARMGLHQDRDERNLNAPIVSISLGLEATFLFGGLKRSDRYRRIRLRHGDVVVWGGPSRLAFHGVAPLPAGSHPLTGPYRYNLTFREAGVRQPEDGE